MTYYCFEYDIHSLVSFTFCTCSLYYKSLFVLFVKGVTVDIILIINYHDM